MLLNIFTYLLAIFMIFAGFNHFYKPEMYNPFIPEFLPELAVNYVTGIIEAVLGAGLFIPSFKRYAALGIMLLMIAFLPLHIIDVLTEHPAIGDKTLAYIRLPIQFIFIAWPYWIWKNSNK